MDALRLFKAKDLDLPEGAQIDRVTMQAGPDVSLNLFIYTEYDEPPMVRSLNAPFIAAMMLRYCFEKKIPLPKNARKDLSIVDGSLMMLLTL